ncbi:hypothetical protein [Salinimicrobium catena]|nr:hypothetical protein [Salinimicrobium catena]
MGQVLTSKAEKLQKKNLQQYHAIETFAFKKWRSNDLKRVKEINDQVEAFLEVRRLVFRNFALDPACLAAVNKHSAKSKRKNPFHNPTVDWKKVLFDLQSILANKRN